MVHTLVHKVGHYYGEVQLKSLKLDSIQNFINKLKNHEIFNEDPMENWPISRIPFL